MKPNVSLTQAHLKPSELATLPYNTTPAFGFNLLRRGSFIILDLVLGFINVNTL